MKLFRRPLIALILSLIIVASSSIISINIKLDGKSAKAEEAFYTGADTVSSHLLALCSIADTLAYTEGFDSQTAEASAAIREQLTRHSSDISYLYDEYQLFTAGMEKYFASSVADENDGIKAQYNDEKNAILECDYNQSIHLFRRNLERFPGEALLNFCGVELPEYFS